MRHSIHRRHFLRSSFAVGAGLAFGRFSHFAGASEAKTTQLEPNGFFTLGQRDGHWWLICPDGTPFYTMGINHIDPASLRYPENIHIWRDKYEGSTLKWIEESVTPNLKDWGFNTVGWVQEVTVRKWRHSRAFTGDEYRALAMPYCHLLPFMESHQWEKHTVHYDFRSEDWPQWCDYVARSHCAELNEDPNLIGYFYSDCPCWTHFFEVNQWRGPIFDPELLESEAGRKELSELAGLYYKTTHDAIRRYDKHHLILGDRYEANRHIATQVMEAAFPYVDVLSFQDFRHPIEHLDYWHKETGKPVLLADAANPTTKPDEDGFKPNDGQWYSRVLKELYDNPGCIGFHLCGAYQRNRARGRGLLDEMERPDQKNVDLIRAANEEINRLMSHRFPK